MSRQQRIREWMATQDGPRTSREAALAIGDDYIKVQWAVAVMLRDGMLVRTKDTRPMLYALGRPVLDQAAINAAAHAGRAGYYARRRGEAAERRERQRDAAAKRAVERQEARRLAQAALNAQRKREAQERRTEALDAKLASNAKGRRPFVTRDPVPAQTVEEFLANGGKVERLDHGAASKFQLQFIGHRGANDSAWRSRAQA